MRARQKTRVAEDSLGEGANGIWSERDRDRLRSLIDPIGKAPRPAPLSFFVSEARGLISASKSEVYDRTSTFLSAVNVTAALVLSAITGMVTSPVDTSNLPPHQQALGIAANMLTYPMVAIQACIVMFSTYVLLMFAAHAHSPDVAYRAIAHFSTLMGSFQVGIYLPLLLWLLQIVLLAHINLTSDWERWTCTAVVVATYAAFHMMFSYSTARAFPRGMWGWLAITTPWLMYQDSVRSDVSRLDGMYLAGIQEAVLHGMDRATVGKVGEGSTECSPEEQQLTQWLDRALPELGGQGMQRSLLIRALVNQGLHLPALTKAARISGGFRVLIDMFSFSLDEDGLELSRGDRLRLATAVMEDNAPSEPGGGGLPAAGAPSAD